MFFRLGRLLGPVYSVYQKRLVRKLRKGPLPHHLAVIMDGNRRFAEQLGLAPFEGHLRGRGKLEEMMEWCQELGIRVLTVYAFSTENLNRAPEELETLMDLFADAFRQVGDDPRIHGNRVRVCALGHRELLPERVRDAIAYAEERTVQYDDYRYNIAVAYGGRQEIIQAVQQLARKVQTGELAPDDIDTEMISRHLYTGDLPDPRREGLEVKPITGGLLVQGRDSATISRDDLKVVTKREPTEQELKDCLFAWAVARHVKSNAIVYAKDGATAGIGAGQMNRRDSSRIAALKAAEAAEKYGWAESRTVGSAVASDAFFPFADGLLAAAEAGATAIIQPGGSMRDQEVIDAANEAGLAMVFTGMRHFRH